MRASFVSRVAAYFQQHPGQWIDGKDLEGIGGRYAWRSRVSDCRTKFGMDIVNRQRHVALADGTVITISEYQFRPYELRGRDAGQVTAGTLF